MTTETRVIKLPFSGFYDSKWSGEIDHVEEQETEYFDEYRQTEDGIPPELHLTAAEYGEILLRHTSYSDAYQAIARQYVPEFNEWFKGETELDLGLTFESMDSPREYNFATDRVYADIPLASIRALFDRSAADGHARLAEIIKARFTSCDGFCSHYDNGLESWLAKPIEDWDHNELETLLLATMPDPEYDSDGHEWSIFEGMSDGGEVFYTAWSNAVDWPKVDAAIQELRDEKAEEIKADNPDFEPVYRCPDTLDMFRDYHP